jgi:hypothetical protein
MKFVGIVQRHDFFDSDFEMSTEPNLLQQYIETLRGNGDD